VSGPSGPAGLPPRLAGLGRCLVMGVLNVTADSFSDGGRYPDAPAAIEAGLLLAAHGADLVDVGGESTRPGAQRVDAAAELGRVLPVVRALADAGVAVSIDTMRAETAAACLAAGAVLVNDVSGGLADPQMLPWLATVDAPYVAMHWRGPSAEMAALASYGDVVAEVGAELGSRLDACAAAGVDLARVVVDPGLGFAKDPEHNWLLLAALDELHALGRPVLVGASRKRFLGELLADPAGVPRPVHDRDRATDAISALAAAAGAWCVRVHDARSSADAVRVAARWSAPRASTHTAGRTR
jgi:dihydropteroate synthase